MSREIIKVLLSQRGKSDILIFSIQKTGEPEYYVDLSSSASSQTQLKRIFSRLLEILIDKDITLKLEIEKGFSRSLQKEVSEEYIDDLNAELEKVRQHIQEQMSVENENIAETDTV